jgi:hypothetical protein
MISKVVFEFKAYIVKNKDQNLFSIQIVSTKVDSHDRRWFNCAFSLSDDKFSANFDACVLKENLHKGSPMAQGN